jgi:hypothetical protein
MQQFYCMPTQYFVWMSEQTAIISQYSFNWLGFITEIKCVYCAVRIESLNVVKVNLGLQRLKSLEHAVFLVLTTFVSSSVCWGRYLMQNNLVLFQWEWSRKLNNRISKWHHFQKSENKQEKCADWLMYESFLCVTTCSVIFSSNYWCANLYSFVNIIK